VSLENVLLLFSDIWNCRDDIDIRCANCYELFMLQSYSPCVEINLGHLRIRLQLVCKNLGDHSLGCCRPFFKQCACLAVASCLAAVKLQRRHKVATIHLSLIVQVNSKVRTLVWENVATHVIEIVLGSD
jgi:hypothetical protein